jgi:hypothetical protein
MTKIKLFDLSDRRSTMELQAKRESIRSQLKWRPESEHEQVKAALATYDAHPSIALKAADPTAINDALATVNGKATSHTYTRSSELVAIADTIEARLEQHGVPQKLRAGIEVTALSVVPTAKAYNRTSRTAIATQVTLTRGTSAWYITGIGRVDRYTGPGGDEKISVKLTDAAREAVIKHALEAFE